MHRGSPSAARLTRLFETLALVFASTRSSLVQLLIVTPTRELAVQCVQETLTPMSRFMQPPVRVS